MHVGGAGEHFDGQFPALAHTDSAAESGIGGCSGGSRCAHPLLDDSHLSDDFAEAEGAARGEDEAVVSTVDQTESAEPVDCVERLDAVAAFANDPLDRSGALTVLVDEQVEDGPLGLGLGVVGRDRLRLRRGR
jgi:hypothetical protein